MFNPLKLKLRIKILVAIIIALLLSFLFIKPKENDIPVVPIGFKLELSQLSNRALELNNIAITNGYAPDYQTDLQHNYYLIQFKKGKEVLFTGKAPSQKIWIMENRDPDELYHKIETNELGNFTLFLPYYKNASHLIITKDTGEEVLNIDLAAHNLIEPEMPKTCGDGVCSDNENIMMCYTDCKYLLPQWMPK